MRPAGNYSYVFDAQSGSLDQWPIRRTGTLLGSAIAKGRITSMDIAAAKRRRACLPSSPLRTPASWQRQMQHGQAPGRPGDRSLSPGDRGGRCRDLRAGAAAAQLVASSMRAPRRLRSRGAKTPASSPSPDRWPARHGRRRFRRRLRSGAGAARCNLHDARSGPRDDGAARVDCGVERRQADAVDRRTR